MGDFLQKLFSGLMAIVMLLSGGAGEASAPENAESGVPSAAATAAPTPKSTPEPTAEPTPEPTPEPLTKESAAALLEDFVRTKAYESDWQDNPYGDEYRVMRYALLDLDGNDIPELLLSSNLDESAYSCNALYILDPDTREITMSDDGIFTAYYAPWYSEQYSAIVDAQYELDSPVRKMVYYGFSGTNLEEIGSVTAESDGQNAFGFYDYQYKTDFFGAEEEVSQEEGRALFEEAKKPGWTAVADFDVKENTSLDITDGYWESITQSANIYKFEPDGTLLNYSVFVGDLREHKDEISAELYKTWHYTWDGTKLEIFQDETDSQPILVLRYVTLDADVEWDRGIELETKISKNEYFFYETDHVKERGDSTAYYMQKSNVNTIIE